MSTRDVSSQKGLINDVVIALCLLALGVFILKTPVARHPDIVAAEDPKSQEMVFRGVSIQERDAEQQASHVEDPSPAAEKPTPRPPEPPDVGGSSRSGTVIELVYEDRVVLLSEAARYGFVVQHSDGSAPSNSVGSIDCPGFRLHFDRALYRRIEGDIGPLAGLPDGTLLSVALEGGRLRRLS